MNKVFKLGLATAVLLGAAHAQASGISDTGATTYWGSDYKGDVIGDSVFDISSAQITMVGSVLTIKISTNFAGNTGIDSSYAGYNQGSRNGLGIGYGDVFLSSSWSAAGTSANHYAGDDSTTGTVWSYGLALDNRYSTSKTGTFSLYQLNGLTNADNILDSDQTVGCKTACDYRTDEESEVDTSSDTVRDTGLNGTWTVDPNKSITFTINVAGSDLMNWSSFAMHWGETCQNDVLEGIATSVQTIPLPGSAALMALGLGALGAARRRRRAA